MLDLEFDDNLVILPSEKAYFYKERRTIESTIYLKDMWVVELTYVS